MKPRIAIIIDNFSHLNGVTIFYLEFISWLEKQEMNFRVFSTVGSELNTNIYPQYTSGRINYYKPIIRIPLPFYEDLPIIIPKRRIKNDINRYAPDLLHIATPGPLGLYCHKLGYNKSTSYHTNFNDLIEIYLNGKNEQLSRFILNLTKRKLTKFYRVIPYIFIYKSFKNDLGIRANKLYTVPYGVVEFPIMKTDLIDDELKYIIKKKKAGKKCVLFVSRLFKEKNIELFSKLLDYNSDIFLVVVGEGPELKSLNLNREIVYIGFIPSQYLASIYKQADIFVLPSLSDTFGRTAFEAMSLGVPTIISEKVGIATVGMNNKHFLTFRNNDILDLNNKIVQISSNTKLQSELIKHGQALAKETSINDQFQFLYSHWLKFINNERSKYTS